MAKTPASRSSRAVSMPTRESESVRIEPIKNGGLIQRSGTRRGKYYEEREFSASKPQLTAAPMKGKPK